jgi:hypothetical protein
MQPQRHEGAKKRRIGKCNHQDTKAPRREEAATAKAHVRKEE